MVRARPRRLKSICCSRSSMLLELNEGPDNQGLLRMPDVEDHLANLPLDTYVRVRAPFAPSASKCSAATVTFTS